MKIFDIIVCALSLVVIIEGFEGEFANPTIFDIVKWISCIAMIVCYIYYRKRGDIND